MRLIAASKDYMVGNWIFCCVVANKCYLLVCVRAAH